VECATAGLTMGYGVHTHLSEIPRANHVYLHKKIPACLKGGKRRCIQRVGVYIPAAIRARTPTSAGMKNVMVTDKVRKNYKNIQYQEEKQSNLWKGMEKYFNLSKQNYGKVKKHILEHLNGIVADNLEGQCTSGHSCKKSSKKTLKKMLDKKHA